MFLFGALALFVAEVVAFIAVGEHIGFGWAVLLLFVVSALGPFMIRRAGVGVLMRTRNRLAGGELPTRELLDGIVVLLGGVLICVPGFITDAFGLLLMIGPVRKLFIYATGKHVARRLWPISPKRWNVINVSARADDRGWADPVPPHQGMLGGGPHPDVQPAISEVGHPLAPR